MLFITMRGLRAVLPPRGLGHPEFPRISSYWADCAGALLSSCEAPVPLRFSKGTHFSFVPGVLAAVTHSQILLSCFSSIQHPMHCMSMLRCGWLGLGI